MFVIASNVFRSVLLIIIILSSSNRLIKSDPNNRREGEGERLKENFNFYEMISRSLTLENSKSLETSGCVTNQTCSSVNILKLCMVKKYFSIKLGHIISWHTVHIFCKWNGKWLKKPRPTGKCN